ncbi:hypothetical protein MHBO_000029 [Bonamia ostreae]|uniref:Uncharacterized protein n=1 Tax=Bonamia ostreae TaxID=126728 RepID=A0ABV2AF44_9EUKA
MAKFDKVQVVHIDGDNFYMLKTNQDEQSIDEKANENLVDLPKDVATNEDNSPKSGNDDFLKEDNNPKSDNDDFLNEDQKF